MSNGTSIVGRKNNDNIDYYQTPIVATEALLSVVDFRGWILEPCCGAGAISRVLEKHNYTVKSSDIRNDDSVYGRKGVNMFNISKKVSNVVSNPPYCIAQEVIEHSLTLAKRKVAMLLKLTFLESEKRKSFFEKFPFSKVLVFRKRITMFPEGTDKPKNSGTITFAWFIWDTQDASQKIGWL